MKLCELYKRLRQTMRIREEIRKEINSLKTISGDIPPENSNRIESLEEDYNRVQQEVISIDGKIRKIEMTAAAVHRN